MALLKCKMCGGDLEVTPGITVAECDSCGTKQTLPKVNEEVIQNLFNRANTLRLKCEFDKAEQIYEKILQENNTESEAHWGIVLCKYGIEYVEDPKTYKRIPTCHRTSYDAVTTDADYLAAVEYADTVQRSIYEVEAKAIDQIQKNILSIVKNEKPFDVFICYKETDENGNRTVDSTIANDIYYQLTQEGLNVFYAAITLEDKLGQEYEPYIFAALNSAKVMLVIGTKPQYFSAVWVKNEWSRFLKLMKADRNRLLIPCYKDMDAYELPEEFAHLQAQNMGKIGFINDVVRGIKKVTVKEESKVTVVQETVVNSSSANAAPLLERAIMFIEDGNWSSANEYCEKVLDIDPKNAQAYLGKLMVDLRVKNQAVLAAQKLPFDDNANYQKVLRFADDNLKNTLIGYIEHIKNRNAQELEDSYSRAINAMSAAYTEDEFKAAAKMFERIADYKDSETLCDHCNRKAEASRIDSIYNEAQNIMNSAQNEKSLRTAKGLFDSIRGYKDSRELADVCYKKAEELKMESIYNCALNAMKTANSSVQWKEIQSQFLSITGYKNAVELARECEIHICHRVTIKRKWAYVGMLGKVKLNVSGDSGTESFSLGCNKEKTLELKPGEYLMTIIGGTLIPKKVPFTVSKDTNITFWITTGGLSGIAVKIE